MFISYIHINCRLHFYVYGNSYRSPTAQFSFQTKCHKEPNFSNFPHILGELASISSVICSEYSPTVRKPTISFLHVSDRAGIDASLYPVASMHLRKSDKCILLNFKQHEILSVSVAGRLWLHCKCVTYDN